MTHLPCDHPNSCGGSYLHSWQGGTATETNANGDNGGGSISVSTPIVGGSINGGSSTENSVSLQIQYDSTEGMWDACTAAVADFGTECTKKAAEKKAACSK